MKCLLGFSANAPEALWIPNWPFSDHDGAVDFLLLLLSPRLKKLFHPFTSLLLANFIAFSFGIDFYLFIYLFFF